MAGSRPTLLPWQQKLQVNALPAAAAAAVVALFRLLLGGSDTSFLLPSSG